MYYLIHFRPSQEFENRAEEYIQSYESITRETSNVLHCTLMSLESQAGQDDIIRYLEQVSHSPFRARASDLDVFDYGSLVVKMQKTTSLTILHHHILARLQQYIDFENTPEPLPEYKGDAEKMNAYHQYGSPHFGKLYTPHITLGEVTDEESINLEDNPFKGLEWQVREIWLSQKEEEKEWKQVESFSLS